VYRHLLVTAGEEAQPRQSKATADTAA
jgi:hypothetical protein